MFKTEIDVAEMVKDLSVKEKRQLPFAVMLALNDAMFEVRTAWRNQIGQVFDSPVNLTVNAVLYHKATKDNLVAEVYLRNEAPNGTPPSRYLLPQIQGGVRQEKPFEHVLRQAGILGPDEFVVPARGFPLDAFGNVPGGIVNAILSDLGAQRDANANATAKSKAKRSRRKAVAKRAVYFESAPALAKSQGKPSHLPRGIFQRTRFGAGSSIRMVFVIVRGAPTYGKRFDALSLAKAAFDESFPLRFKLRFGQALATARDV